MHAPDRFNAHDSLIVDFQRRLDLILLFLDKRLKLGRSFRGIVSLLYDARKVTTQILHRENLNPQTGRKLFENPPGFLLMRLQLLVHILVVWIALDRGELISPVPGLP